MSSRTVLAAGSVLALGLAGALATATGAAAAAPRASVVVAPTHGTPGTGLAATVTLADCITTSPVSLTGTYTNVDGDPATTPAVTATQTVTTATATVYTARLPVPADAARSDLSTPLTLTATAQCGIPDSETSVPTTGSAKVIVDASAPSTTRVTPSSARRGTPVAFSVTGCTGGPVDIYFEDSSGTDFDVPQDAVVFADPRGTTFSGSYTVPAKAALGDGAIIVDCSQADTSEGGFTVQAAASPTPAPTTPAPTTAPAPSAPAAPAAPVSGTPRFTG